MHLVFLNDDIQHLFWWFWNGVASVAKIKHILKSSSEVAEQKMILKSIACCGMGM